MSRESKEVTKFKMITEVPDLIRYLDDSPERLRNTNFLYHYTTLGNAIRIIQTKRWHLTDAHSMNDGNEYENGDNVRWRKLFFASFMREEKENIGMWTMYAQPWKDGVKISIPKNIFKKWIRQTKTIYELDCTNGEYEPTGRKIEIGKDGRHKLRISAVAYSNSDSVETYDGKSSEKKVVCGGATNKNIENAVHIPELTGYVKDMAWAYEKEVRIKAELDNEQDFKRVAIDIPDEVISDMKITAGPCFAGDLQERLKEAIPQAIHADKSLYHGKLWIKDSCKTCDYKEKGDN